MTRRVREIPWADPLVNFGGWWAPAEYVEYAKAVLDSAPTFTEATRDRLRVLLTGRDTTDDERRNLEER